MKNEIDYSKKLTDLLISKRIFNNPDNVHLLHTSFNFLKESDVNLIESDINMFESELSKPELIEFIELRLAMLLIIRTTVKNYSDLKKKIKDIKYNIIWLKQNEIFRLKDEYNLKLGSLKKEVRENLTIWLELELEKTENDITSFSEEPLLDLSETIGTEKIIFLHKLGILDHLREKHPFNTSNNSLATILSAITGEDVKTLQSYINPIYSPDTIQKNNPLNKPKKVKKVNDKLINIGFHPDKEH